MRDRFESGDARPHSLLVPQTGKNSHCVAEPVLRSRSPTGMPISSARPHHFAHSQLRPGALMAGVTVLLTLTGCGMFRAEGQVGPDLRPHFGTSVSIPLGK